MADIISKQTEVSALLKGAKLQKDDPKLYRALILLNDLLEEIRKKVNV